MLTPEAPISTRLTLTFVALLLASCSQEASSEPVTPDISDEARDETITVVEGEEWVSYWPEDPNIAYLAADVFVADGVAQTQIRLHDLDRDIRYDFDCRRRTYFGYYPTQRVQPREDWYPIERTSHFRALFDRVCRGFNE